MAEPSRLWVDHVQRQDAAATFHEGQVKVEAASSRLPSMDQRQDAAATLPRPERFSWEGSDGEAD